MATTPKDQGLIKGSAKTIPAELLNKSRNSYNWNEFEIGDHKEFSLEEGPKARSSVIAFAKGTKDRAPRNFATRTVPKMVGDKEIKVVEIWRLPDTQPVVSASTNQTTGKTN